MKLAAIIDLAKPGVRSHLRLSQEELREPWRLAPTPTRLQQLGAAVSGQHRVSAIRYPAVIRPSKRKTWNVALFPEALRASDRVEILGRDDEVLEILP